MALKYYVKPGAKGVVQAKKAEKRLERKVGANILKPVASRRKADIVVGKIPFGASNAKGAGSSSKIPKSAAAARKGKTKVKVRDFKTPPSAGKAAKKSEATLAMHELGHALGLKHKKQRKNNLMGYSGGAQLTPAQKRRVRRIAQAPPRKKGKKK